MLMLVILFIEVFVYSIYGVMGYWDIYVLVRLKVKYLRNEFKGKADYKKV